MKSPSKPLEFSGTARIDAHSALLDTFIARILDLEGAFLSDESSLWDFHFESSCAELMDRIDSMYGVDVSDI